MAKPKEEPKGDKGRFIGLVGTGHERYQVHLIETVGETVVKRTVIAPGRKEMVRGQMVEGETIAVALQSLTIARAKHLSDVSDLWQK